MRKIKHFKLQMFEKNILIQLNKDRHSKFWKQIKNIVCE